MLHLLHCSFLLFCKMPLANPDSAAHLPNPSLWWMATLVATFLWLCGGYWLGGQCGGMNLIGPCKMVMHASPMVGYLAIAWLLWAFLLIPLLALAALVQTWRRAVQKAPESVV